MPPHEQASCELLRAMRGPRSQRALARRLGYRGNPVTDWEHGRHFPTARDALDIATACRLPVREAFERFHALGPPPRVDGAWSLAPWLDALRGSMTQQELAARCGCSRFAMRRWLSGEAQPKLPDFLRLLDATTGRCFDWVGALVPIERVPALLTRYTQARAAKEIAFEHPWSEALLRLLETERYRAGRLELGAIAEALGTTHEAVLELCGRLQRAGIIEPAAGRFHVIGTLAVDTRGEPAALRALQAHWMRSGAQRLERGAMGSRDWFAYNQISVSRADLDVVRERLSEVYAEIRALVAASEPAEEAALVLMQVVHWDAAGAGET